MLGQLLTLWTIRAALVLYALVVAALLAGPPWSARRELRWIWAASCGVFLVHVAMAFHFYHGWSHALAFEHTAEETRRLLGWQFGYGIYFNYLFAVLWTVDALWWLRDEAGYRRRGEWLRRLVHAYLFFIAFNGAVVFEDGPVRWTGVAATLLLGAIYLRRTRGAAAPEAQTT